MDDLQLKNAVRDALWKVADENDHLLSATITGSFVDTPMLQGISDIDFVVVLDHLNQERFINLLDACDASLRPVLKSYGYELLINPTLGPLKFNAPRLAVLHLMVYSLEAHVTHAISSPFTCLDWQRSRVFRKCSLAELYPVHSLQPRHFLSARRSPHDYISDLSAGVVSFRELECDEDGYREVPRKLPMDNRARHDFAYHVIRFLMRNLLKLVHHCEEPPSENNALVAAYLEIFPEETLGISDLLAELTRRKRIGEYSEYIDDLEKKLGIFVDGYAQQFRRAFFDDATRHIVIRHAPTAANLGERVFVGRTDVPLNNWPSTPLLLAEVIADLRPRRAFSSPLTRCQKTLESIYGDGLPQLEIDERLLEFDYGLCEGLTVAEARERHSDLFGAWQNGDDPAFPGGGESTADVSRRAAAFAADRWARSDVNTITCTHNGVIRTLLGRTLGIDPAIWHTIEVPHMMPLTFINTRRFGLYVDIPPSLEPVMIGRGTVARRTEAASCKL